MQKSMQTHFAYELTSQEANEVLRFNQRRLQKLLPDRPLRFTLSVLFVAACTVLSLLIATLPAGMGNSVTYLPLFAVAPVLLLIVFGVIANRGFLRLASGKTGGFAGRYELSVEEAGLRTVSPSGEGLIGWQSVRSVEEASGVTLVYLGDAVFFPVSHSAFQSLEERKELFSTLRARIGGDVPSSQAEEELETPAQELDSHTQAGAFWSDLRRNLLSGIRMALFVRPLPEGVRGSWDQVIALIVLDLVLTFAAELFQVGIRGQFIFQGFVGALYHVPLIFLAASAFALSLRKPELTLRFAVALISMTLVSHVMSTLSVFSVLDIHVLRGFRYAVSYLPSLWLVTAGTVALVRLAPSGTGRAGGYAFISVALFLGAFQIFVWQDRTLWMEPYDESDGTSRANRMGPAAEDAFYLQPKLLERDLAALQPGRKGTIDLYFVGLAGYSSQDVFMKEVDTVSTLFGDRFDAKGRSVRLINNSKAVVDAPLASVTSLRATLKRIGEVMDPDEDVLFLFMTSHGSKERFSLSFWPMNLHELDPKTLRGLLDESGIKRRVIVVSACYSGTFVDALSDENSLVITAAAADKTSFGCSNEAEFTYFGKAFFNEALRETRSFIGAFEKAKLSVEAREKKEDKESSQPQMRVGEKIREPLRLLEQRLAAGIAPKEGSIATRTTGKFDEFVDLWTKPGLIDLARKECMREMDLSSPAAYARKNPGFYGDMTPASPHWPRLIAAWNRYAEDYCRAIYDEALYRQITVDSWKGGFSERDLHSVLQFLRTPDGQRFVDANNKISIQLLQKLSEMRQGLTDKILERYQAEQLKISEDVRKEQGKKGAEAKDNSR